MNKDTGQPILLAEDESSLGAIIAESLQAVGFTVTHVTDGNQAYECLKTGGFMLAILDVMMPGMDGFTLVQQLRLNHNRIPVLFLTSKTMPHDVVTGFESGGNDYLKKPFSMMELVVRIKALLNTNQQIAASLPTPVQIGHYHFDPIRQQLIIRSEQKQLTARESEILWLLFRHKQNLISRQQILTEIWGDDNFFNARTLDVFITRLRKLLKQDPGIQIINVRGVGYKLAC